jgi:hypothetical protein
MCECYNVEDTAVRCVKNAQAFDEESKNMVT